MITKVAATATTTKNDTVNKLTYVTSLEKISDFLYANLPDMAFVISGDVSNKHKNISIYWHDGLSMKEVSEIVSVFSSKNKAYLDSDENVTPTENGEPVTFDVDDIKINKTFSEESANAIRDDIIASGLLTAEEIKVIPGSKDEIGYTFSINMKEKLSTSLNGIDDEELEAVRITKAVVNKMFNYSN